MLEHGRVGRDLQRRRLEREATISRSSTSSARCSTKLRPRADGSSYARLITFVTDRPGHDRRYAIDATQDRARARLEAGRNLRDRHPQDRALVPQQRRWVAHVHSGAYREWVGDAVRQQRRMKILLLGKDGQVGWELQRALAPLGELAGARLRSRPISPATCGVRASAVVRRFRPDVIVNAAAYTAVDKAESEPDHVRAVSIPNQSLSSPKKQAAVRLGSCVCTPPTTSSTGQKRHLC